MCEPLMPIDALRDIKWSISATVQVICEPGSAKHELGRVAAMGINRRIDWIIANLEAAKEGRKNLGLEKF